MNSNSPKITVVSIPIATTPTRKIAFACTLEDPNGNLLFFNADILAASRKVKPLTGLLEGTLEVLEHVPSDVEKIVIQVASPRARGSQASAARLLVRQSSTCPKGAKYQNTWRQIKALTTGRIVVWKHVELNTTDQLCAMERTCLHLLQEPISFPRSADSAQTSAAARAIAIQRPLSPRADVIAAPGIVRTLHASTELGAIYAA